MCGGDYLSKGTEGETGRSFDHRGRRKFRGCLQGEPISDVFVHPPQLFAPGERFGQQPAQLEKLFPGHRRTVTIDDPEKLIGVGPFDGIDRSLIDH
jgi:hypothetical protein